MKNLIITVSVLVFSHNALAEPVCDFFAENIFVCQFEGTSGLEIFEGGSALKTPQPIVAANGSVITHVVAPKLIGHDLDVKNCISETFENSSTATCFLKPMTLSTARTQPKKTVIRRIDRR